MSGVPAFGPDDPRRHDVLAPVLPKKQPGIEKLVGRALVPFFVPGSQDENVEQKVVEHSQDADEDSYAFNVAVRSFENGYFQEAKPIAPDFASYQQNNNHGRNQRRSNSDAQAPPALYPSPESLYSQLYPKPAHLDQPSYPPQNASAPRGRGGRGRGRGRGRGTGPASFSNGDSASGPTPKKAPRPKASQPSAPVPPTAYAGAAFMNAPSPDQMPLPSFLTSKVVSAPAPSAPSAPLSSPPLSPDAAAQATAQLNFLLATAKQSQAAPVDPATPPLSFTPAYAAVPPVTPPTQPPASTPIAPSPLLQAPFRKDSNPSTTAPVAQPQSSNRFFVSETQSSFSSLPATRSSDSVVSEPPQLAPSPLLPTAAIASRPIASPPAPPLSSAQPKLHLLTASPFKGGVPTKVSIQLVPSAAPAYSALPSPPAQASTPQRSSSLFTQPVAASNPNGAPSASPLQPSARALSFTDAQPAAQGASPPVVLANGGTAAAPTTADPVANASNHLKQMLSISS